VARLRSLTHLAPAGSPAHEERGSAPRQRRLASVRVTDLMKALGRAPYACVYYANVYSSPGIVREDLAQESSKELRKCASELLAALRAVRCYRVFQALLGQLPARADVQEAAGLLIGLSKASKVEDTRDAWKETDRLRSILGLAKQ